MCLLGNSIAAVLRPFFYQKEELESLNKFYTGYVGKSINEDEVDELRYLCTVRVEPFLEDAHLYADKKYQLGWTMDVIETIAGKTNSYIRKRKKKVTDELLKLVCKKKGSLPWKTEGKYIVNRSGVDYGYEYKFRISGPPKFEIHIMEAYKIVGANRTLCPSQTGTTFILGFCI